MLLNCCCCYFNLVAGAILIWTTILLPTVQKDLPSLEKGFHHEVALRLLSWAAWLVFSFHDPERVYSVLKSLDIELGLLLVTDLITHSWLKVKSDLGTLTGGSCLGLALSAMASHWIMRELGASLEIRRYHGKENPKKNTQTVSLYWSSDHQKDVAYK